MSLKLKAPERLAPDGVTTVAFKAWKNNLFSYLEQDTDNFLFLPGGTYSPWSAQVDTPNRRRITTIENTDPERVRLQRKLDLENNDYGQADFDEDLRVLLLRRNAQLSKFIQLICIVFF